MNVAWRRPVAYKNTIEQQVRAAMSEQYLGSPPSGHAKDEAILIENHSLDSAGLDLKDRRVAGSNSADDDEVGRALAQMAREQLARDIADIERATAALRRAEPALQSWSKPAMPALAKPRPLWLLICVLWLSTALVTAGAVAVIAAYAG